MRIATKPKRLAPAGAHETAELHRAMPSMLAPDVPWARVRCACGWATARPHDRAVAEWLAHREKAQA